MSTIRRPRTKRHKPNAEINVVPYIDVMMVLLVIFVFRSFTIVVSAII